MLKMGWWWIGSENELREIVTETMPATIAARQAALVNSELLQAAMAADALLHELVGERPMTMRERTVCEMLVDAIAPALRPTSQ
jgi:hypothetical protein